MASRSVYSPVRFARSTRSTAESDRCLWTNAQTGQLWVSSWHANGTLLAWLTYASIVAVRFGRPRTARSAAAGATAAFAILILAVIGVEALS